MKKVSSGKLKNFVKLKNFPEFFERYELFIIALGIIIVFVIAGFIFYNKAYKTVAVPPTVSVELPKINQPLFEKTLKELEEGKQAPPAEQTVDPFR